MNRASGDLNILKKMNGLSKYNKIFDISLYDILEEPIISRILGHKHIFVDHKMAYYLCDNSYWDEDGNAYDGIYYVYIDIDYDSELDTIDAFNIELIVVYEDEGEYVYKYLDNDTSLSNKLLDAATMSLTKPSNNKIKLTWGTDSEDVVDVISALSIFTNIYNNDTALGSKLGYRITVNGVDSAIVYFYLSNLFKGTPIVVSGTGTNEDPYVISGESSKSTIKSGKSITLPISVLIDDLSIENVWQLCSSSSSVQKYMTAIKDTTSGVYIATINTTTWEIEVEKV